MKVTIVRGIPGSGKSTLAQDIVDRSTRAVHLESDMFFVRWGEYVFDRTKIKEAHQWCQEMAENVLIDGLDLVVSNTFTQRWEYEPYIKLAEKYGAEVEIIVATGNFPNVHGVPDEVVEAMKARWEE